jgi:hypothetical protein
MLPDNLDFEDSELGASSGLSQRFEDHGLVDNPEIPDSQQGDVQQITPDTTIQTESSKSKKEKKEQRLYTGESSFHSIFHILF